MEWSLYFSHQQVEGRYQEQSLIPSPKRLSCSLILTRIMMMVVVVVLVIMATLVVVMLMVVINPVLVVVVMVFLVVVVVTSIGKLPFAMLESVLLNKVSMTCSESSPPVGTCTNVGT